ncbi:hypothetical protein C3408_13230 [Candidatus Pantoea alvi]|uniref:hypothetical protein n=1 Tax=Enterobacter agglomerans TaxID=549 RepID=UPI000CDD17AF|nr:hypothetical protein [Pantoea agglomerans]POW56418.1 hypothetical protein C3408_13230 [Pantoea alvi]UBN56094.1 hypothetical protein LB453_11360 [Pantoea agglomerans]
MTQVTQLIIRPPQNQAHNLVLAIIDVARKQPASYETLTHIRTLATEALDLMSDSNGKQKRGVLMKIPTPGWHGNWWLAISWQRKTK